MSSSDQAERAAPDGAAAPTGQEQKQSPKDTKDTKDSPSGEQSKGSDASKPQSESPDPADIRKAVMNAAGGDWGELLSSLGVAMAGSRVQSGGVSFQGIINISESDITGGSRTTAASTTMLAAERVRDEQLAVLREAYLEPPYYRAAQQALDERHLVVLHGPSGTGKYAASLRLLGGGGIRSLWRLDARVESVSQLLTFEYDEQAGYVVDTLAWDAADRLNESLFDRLRERLRERRSGLVLTVDSRARLDGEGMRKYVVPWREAPDRRMLLERLLRWHLKHESSLDPIPTLEDERVLRFLRPPLAVAQVDVLAGLLADVVRGNLLMEHALDRIEAGAQEVEQWFVRHSTLADYTFMVAAAVLSGASYQEVVQAAGRLARAFGARVPNDSDAIAKAVLANTRGHRVQEGAVVISSAYERLPFDLRAPVEIVELDSESRRQAVLRHVWYEHDLARPAITTWLEELGHHHSLAVRTRAARTAGWLMASEFGLLLGEVVLPWCHDGDDDTRLVAALALGVCANDGAGAPVVRDLVARWIDPGDDEDWEQDDDTRQRRWRRRWTAAAAYGYLGLNDPSVALRSLEKLLWLKDGDLLGVTSRSLGILFEAGRESPSYYSALLSLLRRSSMASEPSYVIQGSLSVFLRVAGKSELREPGGSLWPTMLWLMESDIPLVNRDENDKVIRQLTFELWHRCLVRTEMQPWALDVLKEWIRRADDDGALVPALERFLMRLAGRGERERGLLISWLERWNESARRRRNQRRRPDEKDEKFERPSEVARRLLERLRARSDT